MKPELKLLQKQHYELVGSHSACKICSWTKKSLTDEDVCYKQKFYGIESHRCCQMTPCLFCTNMCVFCWRDISFFNSVVFKGKPDDPKKIIEGCIQAQRNLLSGFGGNEDVNAEKLIEAQDPKQFAISLTGEPTLYPKSNQLIKELHKLNKTSFVVSNGMFPDVIKDLENPTQLYISLDAPSEKLYSQIDKSLLKDAWKRLNKTLEIISKKDCRTALRLTLVKDWNMKDIKGYQELISKADPDFVEVKAYMFVGSSRQRLQIESMPWHPEIKEFSKQLAEGLQDHSIVNEKPESRVVLLAKDKNTMIQE